MLKECAAYFPGDVAKYQGLMKGWGEDCWKSGVVPIMVTVAQVREPDFWKIQCWKNIVKKIFLPQKPTVEARLRDVWAFNDWVRSHAAEQGLAIIDLEQALRISEKDEGLREYFDGGDGLHLNAGGYAALDQEALKALEKISWKTE